MTRVWLVLLLALSLWPSAAVASASAPVGSQDQMSGITADYGSHALRSSGGLEIVWRLEAHGLRCGGCSQQRCGTGPADSHHVLSGSELLLSHARLLVGPGVADVDGAVSPLCENLPYFATAPPFLR